MVTGEEIELYNAWKFRDKLTAWEAACLYHGRNPEQDYWSGDGSLVRSMADSIIEWQDDCVKAIDRELAFSLQDKVSRSELKDWFLSYGERPAFLYPETWVKEDGVSKQSSEDDQSDGKGALHHKERRALLTIIAALFHRQRLDPRARETQGKLQTIIELAGLNMDDKTIRVHRKAVAEMFPDIDYKQNGK